jgi:hypothetical protein
MVNIYETTNYKFDFDKMEYWFKMYTDLKGNYIWALQDKLYETDDKLVGFSRHFIDGFPDHVQAAYFEYLFLMGKR